MPKASRLAPGLPSFHVIANVIAYVGYADEIKMLIPQLSQSWREYSKQHDEILKEFFQKNG